MANKYFDGVLTRDMDWGGDEHTGGLPASGRAVQEFIKREYGSKFGYVRIPTDINENNFLTMQLFANEDDAKLYDETGDESLVNKVVIPISTVQGDSYSAFLLTTLPANDIVVADENLEVELNFRAVKYTQGQSFNEGAYGTLIVQRSTDGGSTYDEVGRMKNVLTSREPNDSTSVDKVNIGEFLASGNQKVRVRAAFDYEDANSGETKTQYSSWVNIGNSVTKTKLELTLIDNFEQAKKAVDANGSNVPFSVSYTVYGAVQKTLYLKVSDTAGTSVTSNYVLDKGVDSVNQTFQSSIAMTHGVKKVEAWMECSNGLGKTLKSNTLVNRFMVVVDESDTKPYLLLQNVDGSIDNFVKTELAQYAVYSKGADAVNVSFLLTSYAEEGKAWDTEYFRQEMLVEPNKAYSLNTTIEIEGEEEGGEQTEYRTYFRVRRVSGTTETDFMKESTNESFYQVMVDNSKGFTPIAGAIFLMNPKVRNNSEAHPDRIYNAKNNNAVVESEWENFGFINDGWMTDDAGNKVLRVMAGSKLTIKKNVWAQFATQPNSSLTFEIDCAVSNVTNTTDPIVQMCDGTGATFKGVRMNALEGWIMNGSNTSKDDCLFAWEEDKRTHFSFNLNHQVKPNKGDVKFTSENANKAEGTFALARVLINGGCKREIKYNTSANDWGTGGDIIIGNEGADIDIYSIRIYENKVLDMVEIMNRNYIASLPKSEDKVAVKERNDLMDGGKISLEKTKNKGLNCMVWHGVLPYHGNPSEQTGWVEIFRYDQDGKYLPEYSGTICKETKSLVGKGQGSTAKTYYDWNLQEDSSNVKATIQVPLNKIHEEIHVSAPYTKDGKQYVDIYGGNLGKNIPIETEENAQAYEYVNGSVIVPDGWIDGNGMYRGMGYRVAKGTSLAQKRVLKINNASSMQSHLIGACNSYDDLHFKVVGASPLQQYFIDQDIVRPVSAKRTEPFMFFNEDGGQTYFKGMGNYGAGKADKVTWGFVKKQMPMYALIEGSDNNLPMTEFRVPFDKNTAQPHYDEKGEFDGWQYNGQVSWDYDLGATGEDGLPTQEIFDKWADIHNFIYYHSTNIKYYNGTFEQFLESKQSEDTAYKYWFTQGSSAFYLFRYDFISKSWINAEFLKSGTIYREYSIKSDTATYSAFKQWESGGTGDYALLNEMIKDSFSEQMRKYLKYFINEKSLQFNYGYVLQFLAGTDNSAKNTYYKIDPVGVQMEEDASFAHWYKTYFNRGVDFDFNNVHQLYFDGDDMDSILRTNNNAHQTKPYYIERMYPYADEDKNTCLYEGMGNQLFNYVEKAYASTGELQNMMKQILNAATELVSSDDKMDASVSSKVSVWGFLHKYFFNIQQYFPEVAYLEQARIRYEFPELLGFISSGGGARSIRPITQSLGNQLENELQYMNQRLIYFASYASFGAFGGDTNHAIGLSDASETFGYMPAAMPDGSGSTHTFTVKSHQYIYPCYYNGGTFKNTNYRLSPSDANGCTFTIAENVLSSDTGIGICGINYLTDLGDFEERSISGDLIINGKRLTRFVKAWIGGKPFRPSSLTINAVNIKEYYYVTEINFTAVDLSKLIRAEKIWSGAGKTIYPKSSNLKDISLTYGVKYIKIEYAPNLSSIYGSSTETIKELSLGNVGSYNFQTLVESIYNSQKRQTRREIQSIHIENVDWTDFPAETLEWYCDVPTCEFKGTIAIKEDDPYGNPRVTWDIKNKINAKFGCVDTVATSYYKGLLLDYKKRHFDVANARIKGNFYVEAGNQFKFEVRPNSIYENNVYIFRYYSDLAGTTMDIDTGICTIKSLSQTQTFANIRAVVYSVVEGSIKYSELTKTIEIWNRPAQVGDLVYADGTFSSAETWEDEKTPVGICIFNGEGDTEGINTNPKDTQKRLMMALEDVNIPLSTGNTNAMAWGAQIKDGSTLTDWNKQYALFDLAQDGSLVDITSPAVTSVYDIPTIVNLSTRGLENSYIDPDPATNGNGTASDYRNTEDPNATAYNDGFKLVNAGYAVGDGFAYNETDTEVKARTLDDSLAKLAGAAYSKDNIVNSGYAKTLKIIQHRNSILNNNLIGADGEVLLSGGTLQLPSGDNEMNALGTLMDNLRIWATNNLEDAYPDKWMQLAYPFASACYAYQPTMKLKDGEVLADKFKAHNFFAPTEGILTRMCWLVKYGQKTPYDPFKTAREKNLLKNISTSSPHWSVTEGNSTFAWFVYFSSGGTYYGSRNGRYVGRAVSAF